VDFESDAVTSSMDERVGPARGRDHVAARPIHLGAGNADCHGRASLALRVEDGVHTRRASGLGAPRSRTGHVGAVAVDNAAKSITPTRRVR